MTALRSRIRALLVRDADEHPFAASAPVVAVREIFRRFWPDARPYRKQIALGLLFLVLVPTRRFAAGREPALERAAHRVGRDRRLPDTLAAANPAGLGADPRDRPSVAEIGAACERAGGPPEGERRFAAATRC